MENRVLTESPFIKNGWDPVHAFVNLTLVVFVVAIIADVIITLWALSNGYHEANPISATIISQWSMQIWVVLRLSGAAIISVILAHLAKSETKTYKIIAVLGSIICAWSTTNAVIDNLNVIWV